MELLSIEETRRADAFAVRSGVSEDALMAAAGRAVAAAITERFAPAFRVLVACGPGANGGDGYVAARILAQIGFEVCVAAFGVDRLKGAAARASQAWDGPAGELGVSSLDALCDGDIVIDALFGAGLSRPLDGAPAAFVEALNARSELFVVAADVPSGLDGDTGRAAGPCVEADVTVTFFRKKPGHLLSEGPERCGEVRLADIGIPDAALDEIGPQAFENAPALWAAHLTAPQRRAHKYSRGAVLAAQGTAPGAAHLAARAALKGGAGYVALVGEDGAPVGFDAIVRREGDAATIFRSDARFSACVFGPGHGLGRETRETALSLLALARPLVLDADALTVFADRPETLFEAMRGPVILTPHAGEFARLFPDLAENASKFVAARAAAARSGAVVVFKGADTVIAAPDGRAAIEAGAPPWLATAGTGDVLAGLFGACLARGLAPFEAAAAGVAVHAEAARRAGFGLVADDLIARLPEAEAALCASLRPGRPRAV